MAGKPRIDRLSLEAQVYRELRDRILSGAVLPETRLVQEELAAEFGVSRIPVRDAIKRLEAEGMLVQGRQGSLVPRLSADEIDDLYLLRERLEGLAARRCAERAASVAGRSLATILDAMAANARADHHLENIRFDYRFHALLYDHAGGGVFPRIVQFLWSGYAPNAAAWITGRDLSAADRALLERSAFEHRAIADAVASGDGEAAERAAVTHVHNARRRILARQADA